MLFKSYFWSGTLLLGMFISHSTIAQTDSIPHFRIGINTGSMFYLNPTPDYDFVRGDIEHYYNPYYGNDYVTSELRNSFFNAELKWINPNRKVNFFAGGGVNLINSYYGKDLYSESSKEYFYMLVSQTGTTTEYMKVHKVQRKAVFGEINAGISYDIFKDDRWRIYAKTLFGAHLKFSETAKVYFFNPEMAPYQDDVLTNFNEHDSFFGNWELSGTFEYSFKQKAFLYVDFIPVNILFPSFSTGILESNTGTGFRMGLDIKL